MSTHPIKKKQTLPTGVTVWVQGPERPKRMRRSLRNAETATPSPSATTKARPNQPTMSNITPFLHTLPIAVRWRLAARLLFRLHEVVADHVANDHVGVFDAAHVGGGHLDMELGEGPHPEPALQPARPSARPLILGR